MPLTTVPNLTTQTWPRRYRGQGWGRGPHSRGAYFSRNNITELPENGSNGPVRSLVPRRVLLPLRNCYAPACFLTLFPTDEQPRLTHSSGGLSITLGGHFTLSLTLGPHVQGATGSQASKGSQHVLLCTRQFSFRNAPMSPRPSLSLAATGRGAG